MSRSSTKARLNYKFSYDPSYDIARFAWRYGRNPSTEELIVMRDECKKSYDDYQLSITRRHITMNRRKRTKLATSLVNPRLISRRLLRDVVRSGEYDSFFDWKEDKKMREQIYVAW